MRTSPRISSTFGAFFEDGFGQPRIALGFGQVEDGAGIGFAFRRGHEAFRDEGFDVFVHEVLFQRIDNGDGFAVVGDNQGLAGDDLFEASGKIVFEIGHTGCLHMARIARI